MKVVLSPRAIDHLREIQSYIAYDNVAAAMRVASRIRASVDMLRLHPKLGRVYGEGPQRRLVVPTYQYCIYYDLDEAAGRIDVLTIQHTHRKPPSFR